MSDFNEGLCCICAACGCLVISAFGGQSFAVGGKKRFNRGKAKIHPLWAFDASWEGKTFQRFSSTFSIIKQWTDYCDVGENVEHHLDSTPIVIYNKSFDAFWNNFVSKYLISRLRCCRSNRFEAFSMQTKENFPVCFHFSQIVWKSVPKLSCGWLNLLRPAVCINIINSWRGNFESFRRSTGSFVPFISCEVLGVSSIS